MPKKRVRTRKSAKKCRKSRKSGKNAEKCRKSAKNGQNLGKWEIREIWENRKNPVQDYQSFFAKNVDFGTFLTKLPKNCFQEAPVCHSTIDKPKRRAKRFAFWKQKVKIRTRKPVY